MRGTDQFNQILVSDNTRQTITPDINSYYLNDASSFEKENYLDFIKNNYSESMLAVSADMS